mmetsp:Transcript_129720/g.361315  ORF Transcript_129720/g.361315 Transcript_129720/m.361315 type:complete len:230 (+) Transcript_129720:1111-1800(+)
MRHPFVPRLMRILVLCELVRRLRSLAQHLLSRTAEENCWVGHLPRHDLWYDRHNIYVLPFLHLEVLRDVHPVSWSDRVQLLIRGVVAPALRLGLQLGVDPAEALRQHLPRPVHARPPGLRAFQHGRQIAVHVLAPEIPWVRVGLPVLQVLAGDRRPPRAQALQVSLRGILHLREVHGPRRLPLQEPLHGLRGIQQPIPIRVKVREVQHGQPCHVPVLGRDPAVSVANGI